MHSWALGHSRVGSGVREGASGTQKSRVYNSLSRGRGMGRELAKQRIWENVPGRGQQGMQPDASRTSAFMGWSRGRGCQGWVTDELEGQAGRIRGAGR